MKRSLLPALWRTLLAALSLVGSELVPARVQANPLDAFGFGARAVAMGGAASALARDSSAVYYNPAGLATGDRLRLDLGYIYSLPILEVNGGDLGVDESRGFQGGLVMPGAIFDHQIGVSLGLFLPDRRITRVRALPQEQPRFVVLDHRPQRIVISTALGLEVFDWLFLGAGLTYLANTAGKLDLSGVVSASRTDLTTLLSGVDVRFDAVRYPTAGLLFKPLEHLRLGLTYRHPFVLNLEVGVEVTGDITLTEDQLLLVENGRFDLSSFSTSLFSPRQLVLSAAWETSEFVVSAEIAWVQWSEFPTPTAKVNLELDLGDLDFVVPIPDPPLGARFHDIVVPRVGAELLIFESRAAFVRARAGYFFEASPAPDQPGVTNYIDGDKHGLSVGLGFELFFLDLVLVQPLELDLAFQWIALPSRRYQKTDAADPIGDYVARGDAWTGAFRFGIAF